MSDHECRVVLGMAARTKQSMADDTKACPVCGETIKAVAVKCRFCGERLDAQPNLQSDIASPPSQDLPAELLASPPATASGQVSTKVQKLAPCRACKTMASVTAPVCPKCGEAIPVTPDELRTYEERIGAEAKERQQNTALLGKSFLVVLGLIGLVLLAWGVYAIVTEIIAAREPPRLPKVSTLDLGLGDGIDKVAAAAQGGAIFELRVEEVSERSDRIVGQRIAINEMSSNGKYAMKIKPAAVTKPWSYRCRVDVTINGGRVTEIHQEIFCADASAEFGSDPSKCTLTDWETLKVSLWSQGKEAEDSYLLSRGYSTWKTIKWSRDGWNAEAYYVVESGQLTGAISIDLKSR